MKFLISVFAFLSLVFSFHEITAAQGSDASEFSTMDDFEKLIKSPIWQDRMFAAQNLFSLSDLDKIRTAEILVEGIILETTQPSSLEFPPRNYLNNSERLIGKLIFNLVDLGPSTTGLLRSYANTLSSNSRSWIFIALGLQKEESAHQEVRSILSDNPDPNLRRMAARALFEYADSADIPVLKEALSDDYNVTIISLHPGSDDNHEVVYPVRQDASSALRAMGYFVRHEGANVILKEPGEWEKDYPEKPE